MPGPRVVALCLSAAGGVSGVGSGARPSEDAAAVVRFALEKVLRPETDVLVALHACSGVPLAPPRGAVEEPVLPDAHPEWMPRSLARAWARFRRARGAFALRLESDLDPDRALAAYLADPRLPGADAPVAVHLVVVGARGGVGLGAGVAADAARRLRRAVLGSVSRGVLDRSPAPVLVVRPRDARRLDHLSNDLVFAPSPTRGSPKLSAPPAVAVVGSAETCVGSPTAPSARRAREDSFPGNWRLFVPGSDANEEDEDDEPEAYPDQFDAPPGATRAIDAHGRAVFVPDAVDPELAGVEADDFRRPRPAEAEAESESRRLLLPGFRGGFRGGGDGGAANVVCVAHDGGEDGAALVRWTLRRFLRPTDRALFIVHVTPVAPDALAREFNLDGSGGSGSGSGSGSGAVASRLMESASDASAFLDACALTLNENALKKQHTPAVSCAVVGSEEGSGALLPGTGGGVAGRWAAEALLRAAAERRVDALVVGSRGRGRAGVGRAAKTCADRAPCAVVGVPSRALDAFRERRSEGD